MELKDILEIVKSKVTLKRYNHTLGVIKEAKLLASIYNLDTIKAEISASLHDICKYEDPESYKNELIKAFGEEELNDIPLGAYHAFKGYLEAIKLGFTDKDIIDPIKYHTLGRINMTDYEKILFISDFSEETREFEEAKIAHNIALKSLDKATYYVLDEVVKMLEKDKKYVSKRTYEILDYYKKLTNMN